MDETMNSVQQAGAALCLACDRPRPERPRVVIVGAGFAGLSVARGLARAPVEVVLIDRHNYHLFQPLLYQVATAGLSPADIASPIRAIMRDARNVNVVLAKVSGIDAERREVLEVCRIVQTCQEDYCLLSAIARPRKLESERLAGYLQLLRNYSGFKI